MQNPLLQHAEDPPAKIVHRCYRCNAPIIEGDLFIGYDEIYCVDCGESVIMYDDDVLEDFIKTQFTER